MQTALSAARVKIGGGKAISCLKYSSSNAAFSVSSSAVPYRESDGTYRNPLSPPASPADPRRPISFQRRLSTFRKLSRF